MLKLTLQFKGKSLRVFPVKNSLVKIGRDPSCDISINNLALSPLHAVIELDNDTATIVDKSENADDIGVVINASKVTRQKLAHNDVIYLGKYSLKVTQEEENSDSILNDSSPDPIAPTFSKVEKTIQGWLQIMNGPKLGRTIKLENAMVRIGMTGKTCAMISCRDNQYYIAHLDGEPRTKVAQRDIGEERLALSDGDMLIIGETQMLFFLE